MKPYLLGIDIGTSGLKAAVFARGGEVIASASENYAVSYPQPGWAEQDPEAWWQAACTALKKLFSGTVRADEIAGIGIDGQSWSAIAVDENGRVLAPTPIWLDTRAKEICDRLNEKVGAERIFSLAGNSLQPAYTTAKIAWYRENQPEVCRKTAKILQSNSFLAYRLTGVFSHDLSQGYGVHAFDMRNGCWDDVMCEALEIPREFLPKLYPCHEIIGTVTKKAAEETGLAAGTPVAAGGLDAACGTLGTGVLGAGETQEQGGQAGGMSVCIDRYAADPRLILGYHTVPDHWLLQGGTTGGGGVLRWLKESVFSGEAFDSLTEEAEQMPAGSDGVIFLPYMAGERSPIWDPDAKGVFYGLDFNKTKGHLIRAALEGTAFALRHNLETAEEAGVQAGVLRAMGGAANSVLWTQIKADVTGHPITVPSADTATTLGAAMLAGVGTGFYGSFGEAVESTVRTVRTHEPDVRKKAVYDELYGRYRELYERLKPVMDGAARTGI